MKRVHQTRSDDCLASCVAALLELDRKQVPHFSANRGGDNQLATAQRWLERKYGLTMITVFIPHEHKLSDILAAHHRPVRFIAVVPVNGGKDWHAVVGACYGERTRVIHDPGGWGHIRLALANEIRLILPVFKRGIPWRPSKLSA